MASANNASTEVFIGQTNSIYKELQSLFEPSLINHVQKEVLARELTAELANRYPALIYNLKEAVDSEAQSHRQWIDGEFWRITAHITKLKTRKKAEKYWRKELEQAKPRAASAAASAR